MAKYCMQDIPEKSAKAMAVGLDVSPKHSIAVCSAIRGMRLEKAEAYLQDVIDMKRYIPLRRFNKQVPHRKGGMSGRYHVKASGMMLKLLGSVRANAEQKEMDAERLMIAHAAAQRGPSYQRRRPKGRMKGSDIHLVNMEIVVKEA